MTEFEIPTVGDVNLSEPGEAAMTLGKGIGAFVGLFFVTSTALFIWNEIANRTGDVTQEVELF